MFYRLQLGGAIVGFLTSVFALNMVYGKSSKVSAPPIPIHGFNGEKRFERFDTGFSYILDQTPIIDTLYIYSVTGGSFKDGIKHRKGNLRINKLVIILPSDSAINTFYDSMGENIYSDIESAKQSVKYEINDCKKILKDRKNHGDIISLSILRLDVFPVLYAAFIDGTSLFMGDYILEKDADNFGMIAGDPALYQMGEYSNSYLSWFENKIKFSVLDDE